MCAAPKGLVGRVGPSYRFDWDRRPTVEPAHPARVVASAYRDSNATTFVLSIPREFAEHPERRRGLNFRLIATAHICARRMTEELRAGRSADWSLGYRHFSGDYVAAELAKGGIRVSARTAYAYVQEVVSWGSLEKVAQAHGKLRKVTRGGETDWHWTRGANVYALPTIARSIRVDSFTRYLLSDTITHSRSSVSDSNTETRRRCRAEGALRWAIRTAYPGCRNVIGYRLAATLKKAGIEEWEAREVLLEYHDAVGSDRSFTRADALASLRSAYRNPLICD